MKDKGTSPGDPLYTACRVVICKGSMSKMKVTEEAFTISTLAPNTCVLTFTCAYTCVCPHT